MDFLKRTTYYAIASVKRFLLDRRGVSTVEYALIVVAIIAIVGVVAGQLSGAFEDLMDDLTVQLQTASDDVSEAGGVGGDTTGGGDDGGTTEG